MSERLSIWMTAELARTMQQLLAEASNPAERLQRLEEAIGKLAQLRREESNAGRLQLEVERWQKKQSDEDAKEATAQKLFPINAALLQYGFHQLIDRASPTAQAIVIQTLERLGHKHAPAKPDSKPPAVDPFEPNKAKSRNTSAPK